MRETAEFSGLVAGVSAALIDTYRGVPVNAPGRVFTDLAVAVADGADAISGTGVLGDRAEVFGAVASGPTAWRLLERLPAWASLRAAPLVRLRTAHPDHHDPRTHGDTGHHAGPLSTPRQRPSLTKIKQARTGRRVKDRG